MVNVQPTWKPVPGLHVRSVFQVLSSHAFHSCAKFRTSSVHDSYVPDGRPKTTPGPHQPLCGPHQMFPHIRFAALGHEANIICRRSGCPFVPEYPGLPPPNTLWTSSFIAGFTQWQVSSEQVQTTLYINVKGTL